MNHYAAEPPTMSGGCRRAGGNLRLCRDRRRRWQRSGRATRPTSGACRPIICCVGPAREARPQVRGIRGAVRQSDHAADGGAPGRSRHLCRSVAHHRPRQGRPGRHRGDRICRQDRAARRAQGPQHHQGRAAQGHEDRQPDRLLGRQHLRRHRGAECRPQEGRLPGSAHERQRHGGRDGRQDRRRHGECRAL